MTILTSSKRKKMPSSQFAAGKGHFPINDPTHARLAISGATRSEHAGNISASEAARIKAKARKKLRMFGSLRHD
jgi:hypothetical protein